MKKILLSLMVVAVSVVTFDTYAQNNNNTTCKKAEKCDKLNKKKHARQCPNPFEGINLTKEQQDKLNALQKPCDKLKSDRKKMHQQRDSLIRDAKIKHLAEIKKILTAEQYVQYLENIAVNGQPKAPKHNRHKLHQGKGHKAQWSNHDNCPRHK